MATCHFIRSDAIAIGRGRGRNEPNRHGRHVQPLWGMAIRCHRTSGAALIEGRGPSRATSWARPDRAPFARFRDAMRVSFDGRVGEGGCSLGGWALCHAEASGPVGNPGDGIWTRQEHARGRSPRRRMLGKCEATRARHWRSLRQALIARDQAPLTVPVCMSGQGAPIEPVKLRGEGRRANRGSRQRGQKPGSWYLLRSWCFFMKP